MRVFAHCLAAGALAAAVLSADAVPVHGQAKPTAEAVLAAARQALGGEKKLAAVKSFTATGRTRQVRGDNLVPIEFEISVELPDKYVRKDEIPAQESGITSAGFNGDDLIQLPPPPAPPTPPAGAAPAGAGAPAGAPRPNPSAARVTQLKQDFTRLMLGMFAGGSPAYPLTFTWVAEAEAPQGKADVLEAKGPNNFTLRYFIHRDTHLPIMVTWTAPAGPARGGRPGGPGMPGGAPGAPSAPGAPAPPAAGRGAPPAGAAAAAPPPAAAPPAGAPGAGRGEPQRGAPPQGAAPQGPPENRLYFAEYRDIGGGVQAPFRLRRAVGADTTEETTFDVFKLNAKIDPKKFEVKK
jgi:hypothetical protein